MYKVDEIVTFKMQNNQSVLSMEISRHGSESNGFLGQRVDADISDLKNSDTVLLDNIYIYYFKNCHDS